eukprot:2663034-Prymnesium_polylepis.1
MGRPRRTRLCSAVLDKTTLTTVLGGDTVTMSRAARCVVDLAVSSPLLWQSPTAGCRCPSGQRQTKARIPRAERF